MSGHSKSDLKIQGFISNSYHLDMFRCKSCINISLLVTPVAWFPAVRFNELSGSNSISYPGKPAWNLIPTADQINTGLKIHKLNTYLAYFWLWANQMIFPIFVLNLQNKRSTPPYIRCQLSKQKPNHHVIFVGFF